MFFFHRGLGHDMNKIIDDDAFGSVEAESPTDLRPLSDILPPSKILRTLLMFMHIYYATIYIYIRAFVSR